MFLIFGEKWGSIVLMFLTFWAKIALFQRKCVFVLNFTETRLKLFLILGQIWGSCSYKIVLIKKKRVILSRNYVFLLGFIKNKTNTLIKEPYGDWFLVVSVVIQIDCNDSLLFHYFTNETDWVNKNKEKNKRRKDK